MCVGLCCASNKLNDANRAAERVKMFSPKMQRPVRINEAQLLNLAERARYDSTFAGNLYKRTSDGAKWQLRWFTLYQVCNND